MKLLTGDPTAIGTEIAPEVQSLTSQYGTAEKTIEETLPAGGEKNRVLADIPLRQASDVAGLVGKARQGAASGIANIVQLLTGIGTTETSAGLAGAELGAGSATSAASVLEGISNDTYQNQQQAGAGIGNLLALLVGA